MTRQHEWMALAAAGLALLMGLHGALAQAPEAQAAVPQSAATSQATSEGGTIHGTAKAGTIPLPGVAITATNTLTGKKFATTTDVDGNYAMTIPKTGRYVVRAELAAFAELTHEVRITAEAKDQAAEFGMQLASRAAAALAANGGASGANLLQTLATSLQRGTQSLNVASGETGLEDATLAGGNVGASLPTLAGMGDGAAAGAGDSVTVQGQQGQMNGLANLSEDQIRSRVEDVLQQAKLQGGGQADQLTAVVGMLGGIMGGAGGGGGFGGGGGRGGGGGGFNFSRFNPSQPHGGLFWQGGNNALNSAPWQPSLVAQTNPAGYQNRFGVSLLGSPYIPGLTKPDTRQFLFFNMAGQKNLNAFAPTPVRVPTVAERAGDFSNTYQQVGRTLQHVTLYDPATGLPIVNNNLLNAKSAVSAQALALENFYPLCNINCTSTDPTVYNYETISNAGSNSIAINTRYQRQLGPKTAGGPFGGFGGGGGQRGGGRNQKPVLRQSVNAAYNYLHSANDNRNIFLPLGGATASSGQGLNVGYTVSYGRINNNASINWNRSNSATRNYFTNTANNPTATAGLTIPNQASNFADARFYNGLPSLGITNFAGLSNETPTESINQTISVSDFVAWRHGKHNYRLGADYRRVHNDAIGGNNPLGSFSFSGYATSNPADQVTGTAGQTSGSGLADFLLGLPSSTSIQAGLYKDYLRENVFDWFVTDDWRVKSNVTLNYGLRYEYFGPFSEKNNHLVNLDHNADFTAVSLVTPGATGAYTGSYPTSLVNADHLMYSPRVGVAWSPRFGSPKFGWSKQMVVRGGYGINYNTGQYATFARLLSHQAPFSVTQSNIPGQPTVATPMPTPSGCTTTQQAYSFTGADGKSYTRPATSANLTLGNGFGCSTKYTINNNWAVDKNYKLGMVQVYNLNLQKTFEAGLVLNVGYNGTRGANLDVVGTPNGVSINGVAPFDYEESVASSRSNSLVVSLQQRQRKGVALGATYTYAHSIDNASGVGGAVGRPVQDFYRLDLEEGNSSFDQRHNLSGTWLIELPFGPNREFLNKGGVAAKVLDGFSLSGSITVGSGTYFTPSYGNSQAESQLANTYTQRPDRVVGQTTRGAGKLKSFFNTAAFTVPGCGAYGSVAQCPVAKSGALTYGTASQGSIEGPGTLSVNTALSRTVAMGGTRSFEARVQASNVFNTVQYSGINVTENSPNFGQVTSAAAMRSLTLIARYRF